MTENKTNFNEETIKRLEFIKWLEAQDGRPDRHGVRTPLLGFTRRSVEEPSSGINVKSFFPDNTTGV